jgi:hypothetical protein
MVLIKNITRNAGMSVVISYISLLMVNLTIRISTAIKKISRVTKKYFVAEKYLLFL